MYWINVSASRSYRACNPQLAQLSFTYAFHVHPLKLHRMRWKRKRIALLATIVFLALYLWGYRPRSQSIDTHVHKISKVNPLLYGPIPSRKPAANVNGCGRACFASYNKWTPVVQQLLKTGRQRIAQQRVVICGMIRNGQNTVEKMFHLMQRTVRSAKDYRVLMFENDSRDNTSSIMRKICSTHERTICINEVGLKTSGGFGAFGRGRFEAMARLRNRILDHILGGELRDWDVMIMVDMDLYDVAFSPGGYVEQGTPAQGWKADMVPTMFAHTEWDAMCGNGVWSTGRYYDTLAFRNTKYNDTLRKRDDQLFVAMRDKALEFRNEKLVPVFSCFGGLAAYKIKALVTTECKYTGDDCEHVTLNQCLAQHGHGSIFINPLVTAHYDSAGKEQCEDPCRP